MDPLELLPPELWRMVFETVDDPQDWLNLYLVSSTFEGVVGDQRSHALFYKVLPHVYKHLDLDPWDAGLGGLLSLRLVSRLWKVAVDKMMDSKEGDKVLERGDNYVKYEFEDSTRISTFLDKFGTHPGNPFIGSFVALSFDPNYKTEEMMADFEMMAIRLMEKFGMYINKMRFDGAGRNLDNVLRQLKSCVELTPNLEKLNVEFRDGIRLGNNDEDYYREANQDLGNHPDPILSKLKWFSFYTGDSSRKLTNLQDIAIRMCCNPATLTTAKIVGVPPQLAAFRNLEKISFNIIPSSIPTAPEEHESNLATYSFPLSRLRLEKPGFIGLSTVVKYSEHFKDSLITLKLACKWEATDEDLQLRLNLPHLKYLTIPWLYNASPFSLLENLSNLEELRVCQHYRYPTSNVQILKWFTSDFEADMSKFHIWEKLPKLKKVKLTGLFQDGENAARVKVYYREG